MRAGKEDEIKQEIAMTQAAAKKQSQDLLAALESLSLTPAGTKSKDADRDAAKVT